MENLKYLIGFLALPLYSKLISLVKKPGNTRQGIMDSIMACNASSHRDLIWLQRALVAADMIKK